MGIGHEGVGNLISSKADVDFYRVLPSAGYKKGLAAADRTDVGDGDISPEVMGRDFFPYRPIHLRSSPPRPSLAHIVNSVQRILDNENYLGAIWTQGSPRIEETMYWFSLLLDTTVPVCGCAAQRTHGQISCDGPKNIVDAVDYITSRIWSDENGHNRAGLVLIQEQQIFCVRDVQKGDARPGGYVATGGTVVSSVASATNRRRRSPICRPFGTAIVRRSIPHGCRTRSLVWCATMEGFVPSMSP